MSLLLLLLACQEQTCSGDPALSPGGLELTIDEHPGWGRETCLECHPVGTFHRQDCVDEVVVDTSALPTSGDCTGCHGTNGVPSEDTGP